VLHGTKTFLQLLAISNLTSSKKIQ